ncbi:hypothetical protein [uncultured Selenomonas sp.]|uniref:hypothetical protein n=1 Tax=uncultured Selenomonas sp. TaxID=159275 RepID=UPI0025F15CFF|nr:hypothetical protein [uncultured Selenomonas sp.]
MKNVKKQRVVIDTLSPLILTRMSNSTVMTDTKVTISGTILRGVFADRYIACRHLGKDAHKDPAFRRLFFGGLRFVDANPVTCGMRAIALPFSLQKEKAKSGTKMPDIQDLLKTPKPKLGYKSLRGYAALSEGDGCIVPASVRTSIALHMSRSGAGERLVGSSRDGGIFNYESIDAGQQFEGAILGAEEDIAELLAACQITGGKLHARIGRSRFTQYGDAEITLPPREDAEADGFDIEGNLEDGTIFLRLDTAFLPQTEAHGALPDADVLLQAAIAPQMGAGFSLGRVYAAAAEVENFVSIWGMKQPREYGLAAGTVFELKKDGVWTDEDKANLAALCTDGIGRRRTEGFGQLRVWPRQSLVLTTTDEEWIVPEKDAKIRAQVQRILDRKRMEQLCIYAYEDVAAMHGLAGKTHFFARLLTLLEQANRAGTDVRAQFRALMNKQEHHDDGQIRARDRSETPFVRSLRAIDLGGTSLYELLTGNAPLPYTTGSGRSWMEAVGGKETQNLMETVGLTAADFPEDGAAFYVYFQQAFRYARKKAAGVQMRRDA